MGILTGVAYGGGNLAANMLVTTAGAFITYFYTEVAGIAMLTVGFILSVCRICDGISDLCMGAIVDKTHSKYGKARPWLLWLSIPYLVGSVALWYSPDVGMTGKIIYAVVTYMLSVVIIYTALSVPYNTLCSLITKDGGERTALSAFRSGFGFGGAMVVNMITLPIVNFFGGGQKGWTVLGILYGVVGCLLYLFCFIRCKETDVEEAAEIARETDKPVSEVPVQNVSVLQNVKALITNKYWLMIIGMCIIVFTVSGLAGVNIYYAQFIFGNEGLIGLMSMATFMPMAVGVLIVAPLVSKFGKRNVSLCGAVISVIGCIIMAIFPTNWPLFFAGMVIKGCGSAPIAVASFAMLADTVEYGEWKSGIRSDGLVYSAAGFGEKVGGALGALAVSFLMAAGGYVANQTVQSDGTILAMKAAICYIPLAANLIVTFILYIYDLDKKYDQIIEDLAKRRRERQ